MVGKGKVVIDRLGNAHTNQLIAAVCRQLVDLVGGVHRVITAGIEEIADIVGLEDIEHSVEIGFGFFERF